MTIRWRQLGLACACALALCAAMWGHAAPAPASPREEMRLPWPMTPEQLSRAWLVCGEFPIPREEDAWSAEAVAAAFANDFLQGGGGEAAIRPRAGWTHRRPDGATAAWTSYEGKGDAVSFAAALPDRPREGVVWYAFTTVVRRTAGPAVFTVGCRDSVKLWVNGVPVHARDAVSDAAPTDFVEVPLRAGENAVLVKVAQREAGNVTFSVLEVAQALLAEMAAPRLAPSLVTRDDAPHTLGVVSDTGRRMASLRETPVEIVVTGAGGQVVAAQRVPRGEQAVFATDRWPDGPYEIRLSTPAGGAASYLYWYRGDALAAARTLVATAPGADNRDKEAVLHAMLAELVVDRLGKDWAKVKPSRLPAVYPTLLEFAELRQSGAERLPGSRGGLVRLVYRDECDDAPQFCRVYLPPHYDPRRRYPVIINLHGRNAAFPPYVRWAGVDQRHDRLAEGYEVITVYPHGRGNTWYRGMGHRDVMRCLEMVSERFSVDDARIYLMGYSMGGAGVWYVGSRHPERFAALAPFYGGYDYRFQLDDGALAALAPRERYRRERLSYLAQAEALRATPVFTSHGDDDATVPVDYTRYAVRLLQRWGYDIRYREHPGKGHEGLGHDGEVVEWLLAHRRQANPPRVSVRAAELRFAAAHWVKVTQRKDPYAFIHADAEVVAPNAIRLATENVLEIELSPPARLIDARLPVRVAWNDGEMLTLPLADGKLVLRAPGYQPAAGEKRPALAGPVTDLYHTPFALVVGTASPDPVMRAMCRRAGQRYVAWWKERFHWTPRVFTDTEITPEEQAQYSLLLIGGPEENAVARDLAAGIPLAIARNRITIDGRAFAVREAAVQMLYPHPLNPDRYVVIRAATSAPAMALTDYVLNDVDFCIVDSRNIDRAGAGRFFDVITGRSHGAPIVAGYFDRAWRLNAAYLEQDAAPRHAAPSVLPRYASAAVPVAALRLADVVETRAEGVFLDMIRGAATSGGKPSGSGIAVAPTYWLPRQASGVEYDLSGGEWTRLRAILAVECDPASTRAAARVVFVVKGDGVVLYQSPPRGRGSRPLPLDLDITGVNTLRLEILTSGVGGTPVTSAVWGDIRLER